MSQDSFINGDAVNAIAALAQVKTEKLTLPNGQVALLTGREKTEIIGEPHFLFSPDTLAVSTLTGIVGAYQYFKGQAEEGSPVIVHIGGPRNVGITSPMVGKAKQMFLYAAANARCAELKYGQYLDIETFIIGAMTNFVETSGRDSLINYVSKIKSGLVAEIEDDGATQEITTRSGLTRVGTDRFENPVMLAPYRTFPEIEQTQSPFVLRLQQTGSGTDLSARAAIFEADGKEWEVRTVAAIEEWLRAKLPADAIILA